MSLGSGERLQFFAGPSIHGELAADRAFADNEAGIRTVWLALAAGAGFAAGLAAGAAAGWASGGVSASHDISAGTAVRPINLTNSLRSIGGISLPWVES